MPLGANVPRRRPLADASSFISPPRTFPPASDFHGASKAQSWKLLFSGSLRSDAPASGLAERPVTLRPFCETGGRGRSEEHTSELQSLMRISYAVFCLNKKKKNHIRKTNQNATKRTL